MRPVAVGGLAARTAPAIDSNQTQTPRASPYTTMTSNNPASPGNDLAVGNPGGGAPRKNDNAVGNSGGAAPENNQNGREHGLYSVPSKALEWIKENDPEGLHWIADKHETYAERAPFDRNDGLGDYLLMTCVLEYATWTATGKMISEGMVVEAPLKDSENNPVYGDDGDLITTERENAVALPLDRVLKQVQRRLDKLGVLPSADNRQADMQELENEEYQIVLDDEDFQTATETADENG
jgi:hypothetical protein